MQTNLSDTLPDYVLPAGFNNHDDYLEHLVLKGASKLYSEITHPVTDRIQQELTIIQRLGFAKYYLIVHDILQAAREMDIWVGPGRGNAAGSIVAFCLGITAMDPLAYGLLFERVLHPDGNTIPDIDSDVDLHGRKKIIDYSNGKYNGKVLITQYDEVHPEQPGLLQVDIIGKEYLSILRTAYAQIKNNDKKDFSLNEMELTDVETFQLFQEGDTTDIPFFHPVDMKTYLVALEPVSYEQLVALYALYHSGTHQFIHAYIQKKKQAQPIKYDLPALEEVLSETFGELIYQEQLMLLSQRLAGFSREESDKLRRALQKKKNILLRPNFQSKFLEGGKSNGYDEAILGRIWREWETKGESLFNKSHAVCFVLIAWQMAYIKSHYPVAFSLAVSKYSPG